MIIETVHAAKCFGRFEAVEDLNLSGWSYEGTGSSRVCLVPDAQHEFTREDVEELIPLAMMVRPCAHSHWPSPNSARAC